MDLYGVLGVSRDATQAQIKKAYRKVANKNHPDHGGDPDAFKIITLAGEVLTDPEKRKRYDESGETDNRADVQVSSLVASMVLEAFAQDYQDPIKVINERLSSIRDQHNSTIRTLERGIEKIKKRIAKFEELNAKTTNVAGRELVLQVLRGNVELSEAQLEDSRKKAALGQKAMSFLNGLNSGADVYHNSMRNSPFEIGRTIQWRIGS